MPRLSFSGFDRADEAKARALFEGLHLSDWMLSDEAGADAVLIDLDSMYGQMAWMKGFDAGKVTIGLTQALRADTAHEIAAIFVVHTDTSSGVTTDLASLKRAIDATGHPALYVVDVVASLGAAPFAMDALGADVVVGASQKGLMCPPGVGIVAVNERAMEASRANPAPRFYWDWVRRQSELSYRKFCGTAPQTLVAGLQAALGLLFAEGLDAVFERHRRLAGAVHAAVQAWSAAGALGFFCQVPSARSVSVTTVTVPPGTDVDALRAVARERFQVAFAGALGPLQGRGFRIGHLGDQNPASILGCLAAIEAATNHAEGLRTQVLARNDTLAAALAARAAALAEVEKARSDGSTPPLADATATALRARQARRRRSAR
jgi:alanine-glyoxylate transaminase/serine-glyoxylate transaminase/serine-pyruvate transaminase